MSIDKQYLREVAKQATGAHERINAISADDIFDISLHHDVPQRGGRQMITGTTNYDDVAEVRCNLCGGYYNADDPESHECEDAA